MGVENVLKCEYYDDAANTSALFIREGVFPEFLPKEEEEGPWVDCGIKDCPVRAKALVWIGQKSFLFLGQNLENAACINGKQSKNKKRR